MFSYTTSFSCPEQKLNKINNKHKHFDQIKQINENFNLFKNVHIKKQKVLLLIENNVSGSMKLKIFVFFLKSRQLFPK